MNDDMVRMTIDPMVMRAEAVADLLYERKKPEYQDEYSQAVFAMMIGSLVEPFKPELKVTGKEDNVIHVDMQ